MTNNTNPTPHCEGDNNPDLPTEPKNISCPLPGFEYCPRASDDLGKPTWVAHTSTAAMSWAYIFIAWQKGPGLIIALDNPNSSIGLDAQHTIESTLNKLLSDAPQEAVIKLYVDLIHQQIKAHHAKGWLNLKAGINVI